MFPKKIPTSSLNFTQIVISTTLSKFDAMSSCLVAIGIIHIGGKLGFHESVATEDWFACPDGEAEGLGGNSD